MKAIAKRGTYRMLVDDAAPEGIQDGACVLENTLTGEQWTSTIQVALKWGYWEPIKNEPLKGRVFLS